MFDFFSGALDRAQNTAEGWMDTATDYAADAIDTVTDFASNGMGSLASGATELATNAVDTVTGFATNAVDAVVETSTGWIDHAVDAATEALTGLALNATGWGLGIFATYKIGKFLLGNLGNIGAGQHVRSAGSWIMYAVPTLQLQQIQSAIAQARIRFEPGQQASDHESSLYVAAYHKGVFERLMSRAKVPCRIVEM